MFGNGSDEVLDLIFRAFCIPKKDNVVILPPTYGMYEVLAQLNNIEVKKAKLDENFQPDLVLAQARADHQPIQPQPTS